jgi:hypothetical protein
MATIIVEDGSIVSGANSYATVAEFTAYCSDRNINIHSNHGDESELLIKAMDYFEQQPFKGIKYLETQPVQFPRADFYIDGYLIDTDAIPKLVKDAQITIAVSIMEGTDPLADIDRATKREKVDVIEIEYMDNSAPATVSRSISAIMRKLVVSSTSGNSFSLLRT